MRGLLMLITLVFAAWSGWWWFAASTLKEQTGLWFVQQASQPGVEASHGGIAVQGYPNRLDMTITAPNLHDPRAGWGWEAGFIQTLALSYKPWHMIVVPSTQHRVHTPGGPLDFSSKLMRASVQFIPATNLPLGQAQLESDDLLVRHDGGEWAMTRLLIATRPGSTDDKSRDIAITARGLRSPDAQARVHLPEALFPHSGADLTVDATVRLDQVININTIDMPRIEAITLREMRFQWGGLVLNRTGDLRPDAHGRAEGRLTLHIEEIDNLMTVAEQAGLINAADRQLATMALKGISRDKRTVEAPVTLANGRVTLGGLIPLGTAPMLR